MQGVKEIAFITASKTDQSTSQEIKSSSRPVHSNSWGDTAPNNTALVSKHAFCVCCAEHPIWRQEVGLTGHDSPSQLAQLNS